MERGLFLLLPVAIAALIMSYQLLVAGRLDQGALPLVVVLGLVLAVREALGEAERVAGAVAGQMLGPAGTGSGGAVPAPRHRPVHRCGQSARAAAGDRGGQQVNQATGALLVIGLTDQESEPGVGLSRRCSDCGRPIAGASRPGGWWAGVAATSSPW